MLRCWTSILELVRPTMASAAMQAAAEDADSDLLLLASVAVEALTTDQPTNLAFLLGEFGQEKAADPNAVFDCPSASAQMTPLFVAYTLSDAQPCCSVEAAVRRGVRPCCSAEAAASPALPRSLPQYR